MRSSRRDQRAAQQGAERLGRRQQADQAGRDVELGQPERRHQAE
jgi:hypothetical protein